MRYRILYKTYSWVDDAVVEYHTPWYDTEEKARAYLDRLASKRSDSYDVEELQVEQQGDNMQKTEAV